MASTPQEASDLYGEILEATEWPNKRKQEKIKGKETKPGFVPVTDITEFTTRPRIQKALEKEGLGGLLKRIHDDNPPVKKIFLILVRANMLSMMKTLLLRGFSDNDLPMEMSHLMQNNTLSHHEAEMFRLQQWQFLSPVLKGGFKFDLKPNVLLPVVEQSEGEGSGFSVVYKVKVHPGHIPEEFTGDLAMKKLSLKGEKEVRYLEKEALNLESLRELDHHHLIRPVAICTGEKYAFIFFPWAEDGDLSSFWEETDPTGDENLVPWMFGQMVGLSNALELLAKINCRHSDLKPQNILVFPDGNSIGTLKITDVGISKFHIEATTKRLDPTSAKHYTTRYCPPEFGELDADRVNAYIEGSHRQTLSRKFDIWSLGCIFLEFLIWAKLGWAEYKDFDESMGTSHKFWDRKASTTGDGSDSESSDTSEYRYVLRKRVRKRLTMLKARLGPDDAVVRDVLTLVEEKMLVFDCKERYTASEVQKRLEGIQDGSKFGSLLNGSTKPLGLTGEPFLDVPLREQQLSIAGNAATLSVDLDVVKPFRKSEGLTTTAVPQDNVAAQRYNKRQIAKLRDQWTVTTNNNFARGFFSGSISPASRESSGLCQECSTFCIWEPESIVSGSVGGFKARSTTCGMCKLLYSVSKRVGLEEDGHLHCIRNESTMKFKNQPVLSLFADPSNTHGLEFAQVGYPTLFPADSPQQYQLLRQWLHVCDTEHGHNPEAHSDSLQMPTRLIHIEASRERLEVIQGSSSLCYAALSHCWGNSPKLCTLTSNLEAFRREIPHSLLPLNFQEAIKVARALKIPYLWIDSLCIVQDDLADWEREAGRMGQVFSNAYCTIAATSAAASDEGFLARQTGPPLSATIETPSGGILHVSEFMEDYHQDLELAPLNTRGWVLQERALSRRTLHFTKTQVYWECGEGIHCERLFRLSNPQAALFADSDFPKLILKHFKGGRIILFQHLYQKYSTLAFTHISDRSVAILGLEKRLLNAFQSRGAFGIFEVYLARSLLWSRQKYVFLSRVPCKKGRPVPSWSWMAYQGPITYMQVPFDQVDWTTDCVFPSDSEISTNVRGPALKVRARNLTLTRLDFLHRVKLDQDFEIKASDLRGVVLGKDKPRESREPTHYVLLITLSRDQLEGRKVHVRAGVAWLLEHNTAPDSEEVDVY